MKFSYGQLWAILFLFKAFSVICSETAYSLNQLAGAVLSAAVQLALIIPALRIYKKEKISYSKSSGGRLVFLFYFIFCGAVSFKRILNMMGVSGFSNGKNILALVLLAVVCFYCSGLGIHALGRAAVIVQGLFVFFLAVLFLSVYTGISFSNFSVLKDDSSILLFAVRDFAQSSEVVAILVLPMFTEKAYGKAVYLYFAARVALVGLVSFFGITVLGRVSHMVPYPFFSICSFSLPFSVQRSDALFIIAYALICIVNITADIVIFSDLLSASKLAECIKKYSRLEASVLMLLLGFLFHRADSVVAEAVIVLIFIILGYIAILNMKHGSSNETECERV